MTFDISIQTTKTYKRTRQLFDAGKKVIIHKGGTGSAKTYSIVQYLFYNVLLNPRLKSQVITVVSESRPHLEIGVVRYLTKFATELNILTADTWNKSKLTLTNTHTGSILELFSADRIEKALGARRDWLYGNEINSLKVDVWEELARRSENIIADFNPTAQFWLEEWLLNYDDTAIVKSNYTWNKFLPETERGRIVKRAARDKNFRRIHIECEYGIYEGLIFTDWVQVDELPAGDYKYGIDFGYTNDPTAIVRVLETEDAIYVQELCYRTGMLNRDIAAMLVQRGVSKDGDKIIADSAEPKSIEEIYGYGFNIHGARKGADSIRAGIDRLKTKTMYVTKDSLNLIKELRAYSWEMDKTGRATNKPIDGDNHLIDALRYACEPRRTFDFYVD